MNLHIRFARAVSSIIATVFITFSFAISPPLLGGSVLLNVIGGLVLSGAFCFLLFNVDKYCRKCHLKIFNSLIFGLFAGIFLGKALTSIFDALILNVDTVSILPTLLIMLPKSLLYLMSIHFGIVVTLAYQEDLHISIPFIKFSEVMRDKKDIIINETILSDPRILDFLSTGILNNRLILPAFIIKNLQAKLDSSEEHIRINAKKTLDVIEKLKSIRNLDLKENNTDFNDISDVQKKISRLAKITKSNILVGDRTKLENESTDIQYISLNSIAGALKNVMSTGENIEIKVQRYGKEPKQGVGYLEDGTMVVINNGGQFIGEVIDTQVISVKQTSAGRIIFTNAVVEEGEDGEYVYDGESVYQHNHD